MGTFRIVLYARRASMGGRVGMLPQTEIAMLGREQYQVTMNMGSEGGVGDTTVCEQIVAWL